MDKIELKLAMSKEAVEQIASWMPDCYNRDDYPREGCTVVFSIGKESCSMAIYAPHGKRLEAYAGPKRDNAGRFLDEWLRGLVPGKTPIRRQDQP